MKTLKLKIIELRQPIGQLVITKIKPDDLLSMSIVDRRKIKHNDKIAGVQRELKQEKVRQIQSYLTAFDATFPNSIIVSVLDEFVQSRNDKEIELIVDEATFSIIDGQHRVEGFRESADIDFELILTIFIDLDVEQQANIFATINSQQTKVDPSLSLSSELDSTLFTPDKMMVEIAQSMNFDKESPWYKGIKLLGAGTDGMLSLSPFVKPLLALTYKEHDYHKIRNELKESGEGVFPDFSTLKYKNEKYIFWDLYKKQDFKSVYKILFNYFNAMKNTLSKDWLNANALLTKTTGYNAVIKLFADLAIIGFREGDMSYDFFYEKLKPLSKIDGTINSRHYGASGQKASNELYGKMKRIIDDL